jgi:hypothetical protein
MTTMKITENCEGEKPELGAAAKGTKGADFRLARDGSLPNRRQGTDSINASTQCIQR